MKEPFVSIIIPNYNHARFLDQRIQSVLNQTYQNFEVIILDDCSPDDGASKAVIEKYRGNPHVSNIIYNEENCGNTFIQWEKGLRLSRGEICWIAESDDYCEMEMLSELVAEYVKHPDSVIAYSTLNYVDENNNVFHKAKAWPIQHFSGKHYVLHYLTLSNHIRNASCAIFSRKAALNISSRFKDYPSAGDYFFWIEIAMQGSVSIVNKGLSYFRRHSNTVTSKHVTNGTNMKAGRDAFDFIKETYGVSLFRNVYVKIYHKNTNLGIQYDNQNVKESVMKYWNHNDKLDILEIILLRVTDFFTQRFNYYL